MPVPSRGRSHKRWPALRFMALYDVVLDLREESDTFGQHQAFELTAENRSMVYIPKGCAHGFMTLENNTEITSIELYNATGSLIKKEVFNDEELSIYQEVPGLYFAVLKDQQGQILGRTKLIIE